MTNDFNVAIAKGGIGLFAAVTANVVDHVDHLDRTITLSTKFGGLVVVVITIISLSYDVIRKRRRLRHEDAERRRKCLDCDPECADCPDKAK